MKKFYIIKILLITLVISMFLLQAAAASEQDDIQLSNAQALVKLNILNGYPDGSLKLENKIKRSEFITLIVKMLGYDKLPPSQESDITFKDINKKHWAYNYIKCAYQYKLITGTPDHKVLPDSYITNAEALTVLIRALEYENSLSGKWPDNVIEKSNQLGISQNLEIDKDKQISRGEMSVLVYNSLTIDLLKT
ncbi:MAG: S-layer homology domain-containing protein [Clostridia bacterium]|nr:S-layer homology domain-containing protein [Clostridia bacterium]